MTPEAIKFVAVIYNPSLNCRDLHADNSGTPLKHSLLEIMFANFQLPARPRVYDVSDKASKESLEKLKKPKHQVGPFSCSLPHLISTPLFHFGLRTYKAALRYTNILACRHFLNMHKTFLFFILSSSELLCMN